MSGIQIGMGTTQTNLEQWHMCHAWACGHDKGLVTRFPSTWRFWAASAAQWQLTSLTATTANWCWNSRCNNETEAALCTASEARCLPSESGSTKRCSSCFGRTRRRCFEVGGEERCIKLTNYMLYTTLPHVLLVYYCPKHSEPRRGVQTVWGPRSEVRSVSVSIPA